MVAMPRLALSTDPAENKAVGCKQELGVKRNDVSLYDIRSFASNTRYRGNVQGVGY